jgi:membrane-bound lytic murein transglycosylase D
MQKVRYARGVSSRKSSAHVLSIASAVAALTTLVACGSARAQGANSASATSAGGASEVALGDEAAALVALREAEQSPAGASAPSSALSTAGDLTSQPLSAERLRQPEIFSRISPTILATAERYRSDRRARRTLQHWHRDAGRYRGRIESWLRAEGVPAALLWVAAAESAFNVHSESAVGAMGLWQLMPETARSYGLRVDAWVDERKDPEKSTRAAARLLRDLRGRFGSWELALAAYNMGYGALLRAIRRYNTNDFETLAALEGGLPFETAKYVPRIMALALAAANPEWFALGETAQEPAIEWDDLQLTRSVPIDALARGMGVELREIRQLNPSLLGTRTPFCPDPSVAFTLHVPRASLPRATQALSAIADVPVRRVRLRFGESLSELADRYGTTSSELLSLSGLSAEFRVTGGTELFVPDRTPIAERQSARALVIVSPVTAPPPNRRRVFYRSGLGDTLREVAAALGVTRDELVQWNSLDPNSRLPSGLWLQAWIDHDPPNARVQEATQVEIAERGTDAAAERVASQDGRVRLVVTVRHGDSMTSLAARYGLTTGSLSRINRRARNATLRAGESLVVWVTPDRADQERLREGDTPRDQQRNLTPAVAPSPGTATPSPSPSPSPSSTAHVARASIRPEDGSDRSANTALGAAIEPQP